MGNDHEHEVGAKGKKKRKNQEIKIQSMISALFFYLDAMYKKCLQGITKT